MRMDLHVHIWFLFKFRRQMWSFKSKDDSKKSECRSNEGKCTSEIKMQQHCILHTYVTYGNRKKIIIFHKKIDEIRKIIIRFHVPSLNILFWLLRSIIITIFFCREAEKFSVKGVQCAVLTIFMETRISVTALFFASHNFICRVLRHRNVYAIAFF